MAWEACDGSWALLHGEHQTLEAHARDDEFFFNSFKVGGIAVVSPSRDSV